MVFPIRVRDKRGRAVAGLTENDLTLKDEDNVTTDLYLYQGADRVSLVFALDQSGSLREIMNQQREAALALFAQFGEKSQVAVMRFADNNQNWRSLSDATWMRLALLSLLHLQAINTQPSSMRRLPQQSCLKRCRAFVLNVAS